MAAFSQFQYRLIDDGKGCAFKKSYCASMDKSPDKGYLCLEEDIRYPYIYIAGTYFCDSYYFVRVSFNNGNIYELGGKTSSDNIYVVLRPPHIKADYDSDEQYDMTAWDMFFNDLKQCTFVKFRLIDEICGNKCYIFYLKDSKNAVQFVTL